MITIDTVLVKLASRCNLNCDYCYVYQMGDESWRNQPKRMTGGTVEALASALGSLVTYLALGLFAWRALRTAERAERAHAG